MRKRAVPAGTVGGLMAGACAKAQANFRAAKRHQALATLQSDWTPAAKAAFAPVSQAEAAFAEVRGVEGENYLLREAPL